MAFNIKYLSGLSIYKNHREQFVKLIDFFELLKSTHAPTDKKLKKSNIERNFKKINIEGQVWVSVRSVLTFIFQHDKDFDVCQQIASEIERKISTTDVEPSTLCLYEEIVKANYWTLIGDSGFLQLFDFEEDSIPSVCDIHKKDFNNENWTKICLFEKQFSETHLDISRDSYEKQLAKKWDFHCKLCNAFQTSKQLQNDSRSAINTRLKRKLVAQKSSAIKIKTTTAHLPEILESQILDLFPKSYEIASCLCVDCTRSCSHEPAVHVYLGFSNHKLDNIKDIESSITSYLENKHSCNCAEIVFFDNNTSKFDDETGKRRFKFRDLYLHGKLQSDILYQCLPAQDVSVMEEQTCNKCFPSTLPQPLQGNTFEILPEWYINTPLICQILLEPFVNKRSLAKADTKDVFLKQKLTKLYTLYDTLLNTSNRNYSGVLQDISTQELSMNFQSIKSVFSVTGAFGTTKSLRSAENMIKLSATDDKCYYDTYLRKFEMNYTSAAGQKTEMVNLRECVIILMMDNLVRLKYHADPHPGESRSMQMCTLPITLKGLPKDCIEVEHWHHPDCDGDDICSCKKDRSLSKEDVERLVMNLTEAEDDILLKFKQLNTWGYKAAWEFIFENDVHKTQPNDFQWDYIFSQANIDSDQNATMNLEESLASLHIDESLSEEEDISLQVPHSSLSGAVLTTD